MASPWQQASLTAFNAFVFLGALELSLRLLRPLWLALFVAEGASLAIGSLAGALAYHQHFAFRPFLFIDPVVFSAFLYFGLRLLKKWDRRVS